MPPEIIAGRYRVQREVGRGGMGSVWLCRDERLDRDVAVKQVGGLPGESSMQLVRALREARHSAALNHLNVVSIFDVVEEIDHVWLVMEYVPSRDLSEIIRADGPLPYLRAARIGAQVADGVAAAHALGTIHRDVKPGNILVRDDDVAKIADFGIARNVDQDQLTRTGMVTGTPSYFSPELARGEDPTPASDVWALGATLYAAVEGRPPYPEKANAIAMLTTISTTLPPRPRNAGALEHVIARMMDPDPGTRWSMADAAHALRRVNETARVEDTRERTALLAAPTAAAGEPDADREDLTPAPLVPTPPVEPAGSPAPDRRRTGAWWAVAALLLLLVAAGGGYWLARDPGGADPEAADDRAPTAADSSRSPSKSPSKPPTSAPTEDGSPETPDVTNTPTSPPPASPVSTGSRMQFVETYYSFLPEDTETSWRMLASDLQQQIGIDSYQGFWATVDAVSVEETSPSGPNGVVVTLTYSTGDRSEQETRILQVERTDQGYLITGDEGPVAPE